MKTEGIIILIASLALLPFFALAINDVQISDNTNLELNTFDTAVVTTIVASSGGQITNFDVQSNYIDVTFDNLSSVTLTTTVGGQFLKITKQSGSDDYTVSPSCPTTSATLTGTGATVVLRLEVLTTDTCPVVSPTPPVTPPSGGGGGILPIAPPIASVVPVTPAVKPGDLNGDNNVNILDFNALMANWGSTDCASPSNISGDCNVGIFDFNLLMVYWGTTYPPV